MQTYIGTPTSRIDGRDKVTGTAKYAGEFNVPGLVYGSVVTSTVAKGRITRIDASEALRVAGVLAVLTHENRPAMAKRDSAYKDDVAPEKGSPFRPLYDDKVLFDGQPVALVLATEWETARFAASLVRVEYARGAACHRYLRRTRPGIRRSRSRKSRAAMRRRPTPSAAVRHEAEYFIPTEYHNPMELYAATAIWEGGGKLTVYDKTQGVQNVQRYLCAMFGMKPDELRVMSPLRRRRIRLGAAAAIRGGARGAGSARARALGAPRSDPPADVRARPPARLDRAPRARRRPRTERSIRSPTRRSRRPRNTRSSPATTPAGRACSTPAPTPNTSTGWRGSTGRPPATCARRAPRPASMRSNARWTSSPSRSSSTRWSCGCAAIRSATRTRTCPTPARRCATATGRARRPSAGTSATPSRGRCATASELVGWGMATGVWEALQMPYSPRASRSPRTAMPRSPARPSDIGTGTYTIMAQVAADMLGLPLDNVTVKLGDSSLPAAQVEGGSWTAASVAQAIANAADDIRERAPARSPRRCRTRRSLPRRRATSPSPTARSSSRDRRRPRGLDRRCDAPRRHRAHRARSARSDFKDDSAHARNTHSAIFAEVKVDEELGVDPRDPRRQRRRGRAHPQHQDRAQPDHGRRGLGHRHGAARGDG